MLALALFALLLPVVGPLDDHHFAERTHNHGHIYLNGRPAPHAHLPDAGQWHWHPVPVPGDVAVRAAIPGAVAYFTDPGAAPTLAVLNAPWHREPDALRPPPARGGAGNPLTPFASGMRPPHGHTVLPPLRPPVS